ncbi:hypothetical protein Aduo_009849 [Ancylostoma duodenale]
MMANFCRELPGFDLKFACNFKGCLDNRPLSMMGAIEHQAFHFCETFKTQAHFNFKCDFCNVYHVNKSHHRLCLNDTTGNGHITYLRSVFTVPMSDQEYHDCVDFSRFANQHMLAVTGEGVRLVPEDRCSSMPRYSLDSTPGAPSNSGSNFNNKRNSVSYRDIDNDSGGGDNDRFNRSGGNFSDRNQSGSYEYRGRGGRGGFRGRGDRGGFGRGRGRGGGHRDRDGDDDNSFGGRDNEFRRGRGRGRGGFRDGGNDSFRSRGNDSCFQGGRSYSRSRSGSPVAAKKSGGGFNKSQARSYSRSRSGSPVARNANTGGGAARARSYSRSGSNSPPPAKKFNTGAAPNRARSYSRSQSGSPPPKAKNSPPRVSRPPASYSRSRSTSRSPPRNDENNNAGRADRENTRPNPISNNDSEDYMTDGYGCGRISAKGRANAASGESNVFSNGEANQNKQWSYGHADKFNDSQCDGGRGVKRAAERKRSYSKSPSSSP